MYIIMEISHKLNLLEHGTISNDCPPVAQSPKIVHMNMMMYQLQTVYSMRTIESSSIPFNAQDECSLTVLSDIGILSNKIGSGKSLCVLNLISLYPTFEQHDIVKNRVGEFAVILEKRTVCSMCNLIVAPNHLISPIWEYYITNHTTLSYKVICPNLIPLRYDDVEKYDVVLCGAKYYNMLIKTCDIVWCRVFFDEADSINISACTPPRARFVWLISSSLQNLLFPNGYFWKMKENKLIRCVTTGIPKYGYIRNTCKHLETSSGNNILPLIIVKLNDDYIDSFMNLHHYDKQEIVCEEPYYLRILHDEIPSNIEDYLNGSDMDTALEKLGCPIDTRENLISYFCRQFESQKNNLLLKKKYYENMDTEFAHIQDKLKKTNEKISHLDSKLNTIRSKIAAQDNEQQDLTCPICLETTNDRYIFTCCLNVYCNECVKKVLVHNRFTCPLCRGQLSTKTLAKTVEQSNVSVTSKEIRLAEIISNMTRQSRVLIVVKHQESMRMVCSVLYSNSNLKNLKYRVLNSNNVTKVLSKFDKGQIHFLVINASQISCGLNITNTTDIVFYQRMSVDIENQIIGRAHRLGRKHTKLTVYTLLHTTE